MNLEFLERKDFWSGLMLIALGGGAVFIARNYQFGSSLRMGPGYFPIILGGALVMFGVYFLIQGLRAGAEKLEGSWSLRALIILPLSLVLFGLLIDRAGFIPAMLALIIGSATASTQFKLVEVLVFAVFMTAMCVIVFVWALGLPYELITGIW
ncbi:MAG TPA: tripartite tricarboxylate transporter TctB family protein [Xanthobacteraceae bacterium]|nr:tripartite tricarboxylate transporter TctB family protein [Xanthobacteraceae bacterium]